VGGVRMRGRYGSSGSPSLVQPSIVGPGGFPVCYPNPRDRTSSIAGQTLRTDRSARPGTR
jgi:hypothetical protein